jgi:hypothetical protein
VRQGDPLSPLLFNFVPDVLTKMIDKASKNILVSGLLGQFRPRGILALQYEDGTLLFSSYDLVDVRNLKGVMMLFEKVSGVKINFHKSELIPVNVEENQVHGISHILNCPLGSLPFKYLGVTLHIEKLKREDLQPIIDKMLKRAAGWRGKLLVYNNRLVLIKSCLASIPVYLLSFIKFSKWAIKLIESQMAHCLWNDSENAHKYHLASWKQVTMRKEFGGLGVPDLRELNLYLLRS